MRVLQMHSNHAAKGGATEVMDHERLLLESAGHAVEQYTVPAMQDSGLTAWRAGAKAVWNREATRDVAVRIASFRPHVVHTHTPFPLLSPAVFRTAHAAKVPVLTTLHSYRYSCVAGTCVRDGHICEDCVGTKLKLPGIRHRCYHDSLGGSTALTLSLDLHRALGTFHHSVSRYLALTDFSARLLVRDGYPAEKVVVKPNSVPDEGFRPTPTGGDRRVVFAGRLLELKGIRTLLDAWRAAAPKGVTLTIAGDGALRGLVEQRASADPSIEYVGWLQEPEVAALMGSAELTVVPSQWYEGAPLVILRSLSVGTPVLVSDLENLSTEVLQDQAGWTFATGKSTDLAKQITWLVSRQNVTSSARARARRSYEERYSPRRDLERLEALYDEVVRSPT